MDVGISTKSCLKLQKTTQICKMVKLKTNTHTHTQLKKNKDKLQLVLWL